MKKSKKSIFSLKVKQLQKQATRMIVGGADSEVAIEELEVAIESWTLDYT